MFNLNRIDNHALRAHGIDQRLRRVAGCDDAVDLRQPEHGISGHFPPFSGIGQDDGLHGARRHRLLHRDFVGINVARAFGDRQAARSQKSHIEIDFGQALRTPDNRDRVAAQTPAGEQDLNIGRVEEALGHHQAVREHG
nr:MAG: hypothetical protein DIU68_10815 [Chloroflexota bacterium]